ncbi:MAG: hypothetical protein ACC682_07590 [Gemmatimonadota bacterium]
MAHRTILKFVGMMTAVIMLVSIAGCSDSSGPQLPIFDNPSTVRVVNDLLGPVLFFRVRGCGTTDWGEDLLPTDPVEGTIQPGNSKDFTVEAGCYDLQAQHLETTDPGPLVTKEIFDVSASPVTIFTWTLEEVPAGPA